MTKFKKDILGRLEQLKSKKLLNAKTKTFNKTYLGSVSEENGAEISKLNEFQIAFIDLFEDKNIELGKLFSGVLESEIKQIIEPENLEKINLDEDIGFYCLKVPQEDGNDEWTIELATSFDETIFHCNFTGWDFHSLDLTH